MTNSVHIWYADGAGSPRLSPQQVLTLAGFPVDQAHRVTLGWTVERQQWIDQPMFQARTVLAGYALARAVNEGRIKALPVRLSSVATLIAEQPPDIAVISGHPRGQHLAFVGGVGWADVLATLAERVVVEIDAAAADLGTPQIAGNIVATAPRPQMAPLTPTTSRVADEVDLVIGRLVVSKLPDQPTLQFGPGGIGEGIAQALDRPVEIWSGLVTDAMANLHPRGLLSKPAVAAYAWGGQPIRDLADADMLQLVSSTMTHDLRLLANIPRFVGCNTALQVGLDGAVNVERVNGRTIAAVGGHADFCLGATQSIGGLSIIAVRATTASGASTIVPTVDVVSTQRSDIGIVITEYGIADLRSCTEKERASRLVAIAAPQHREQLGAATVSY